MAMSMRRILIVLASVAALTTGLGRGGSRT
jgi:hypothetical protein